MSSTDAEPEKPESEEPEDPKAEDQRSPEKDSESELPSKDADPEIAQEGSNQPPTIQSQEPINKDRNAPTEPIENTEKAENEDEPELDPRHQSLRQAINASFHLLRFIMIVLFFLIVTECVRYVDAGTVAVKERFGNFVRDDSGKVLLYTPESRFVFVLPEPIEKLHIVSLRAETLNLNAQFWPKINRLNSLDQDTVLPAQESMDPNIDGYNLTGDFNIVHSQWQIEYKVSDPVRYLSSIALLEGETVKEGAERIIGHIAASVVTRNMAVSSVDQVLTGDLSARILSELRAVLSESFDGRGCGVEVTAVNNRRLRPPGISQRAFNQVASSLNEKNKAESEALAFASRLKSQAEAEAKKIEQVAEVHRRRIEEEAKADALALRELLKRFPNNPRGLRIYLLQRRQDWLREILQQSNLYLLPENDKAMLRIAPDPREASRDRKSGDSK